MAGKALINGTAYTIKSGKDLINGTIYSKKCGKTLVNGTVYSIDFGKFFNLVLDIDYSNFGADNSSIFALGIMVYDQFDTLLRDQYIGPDKNGSYDDPFYQEYTNRIVVNRDTGVNVKTKTIIRIPQNAYIIIDAENNGDNGGSEKVYYNGILVKDNSDNKYACLHNYKLPYPANGNMTVKVNTPSSGVWVTMEG